MRMVKFYRTELPQVEEGYKHDPKTQYYHKLLITERRKDNRVAKMKHWRLKQWKRTFGTKRADWYSDETLELAPLFRREYRQYSAHAQMLLRPRIQLKMQRSIRALVSKWYYLEHL